MTSPCHSHRHGAYRASRPRRISGLATPCFQALESRQSDSVGASFTTALTSTLGSMSISVEGGP